MLQPLANDSDGLNGHYPTVVVGSGYGGSIVAARLAACGERVCLLERGREWSPGEFPDTLPRLGEAVRSRNAPLGLFEYLPFDDIDIVQGCGLGGTSLINANVAFRPDPELFDDLRWPSEIRAEAATGTLWQHYRAAEEVLKVGPHPRAANLKKVQALEKRAEQLSDAEFGPVNIAVNFEVDGVNGYGVEQRPCSDCGDCISGCNVRAKNTLPMNYLPYAKAQGTEIFTGIEVNHVEPASSGGIRVHYRSNALDGSGEPGSLTADRVVLCAGSLGSTGILLRSRALGLGVSDTLGAKFGGNGDFFGLAYNGDRQTDVMGFGNHPESPRAEVRPGPTIVAAIRYKRSQPLALRSTVEDLAYPSAVVDLARKAFPKLAFLSGNDTDFGFVDRAEELQRIGRDLVGWDSKGALNGSMLYLVMADEGADGRIELGEDSSAVVRWPGVSRRTLFKQLNTELEAHTKALGGTFVPNFRWTFLGGRNLVTAHPLGGCALADDPSAGVVDHRCRVFDSKGGVHEGLYVVDGSVIPMPLGVNPFLTISAISERAAALIAGQRG